MFDEGGWAPQILTRETEPPSPLHDTPDFRTHK